MSSLDLLKSRNQAFAADFAHGEMPALPRLGTLILTCIDARVDPAHVLGVELGEAVVFRNNGGRVTPGFLDEVTALAALVTRLTGAPEASFQIILMEHTKCGAQAFADPDFHTQLQARTGVDMSSNAVTDPAVNLVEDVARLRDAPHLSGGISVAAMLYDVERGVVKEIAPSRTLADLRSAAA